MTIKLKINGESIDVKSELTKIYNRNDIIIHFCALYIAMCVLLVASVELIVWMG